MADGSTLRIVYHGGSQPGAVREIAPVRIDGDLVIARCMQSGATKTFALAKIAPADEASDRPEWAQDVDSHYGTLSSIYQHESERLERLGWHVELHDEALALYRRFKNGKLRKRPTVALNYDEIIWDTVVDEHGETHDINHRPRVKPWSVRADGETTRSFAKLPKAAMHFLECSRNLAPTPTPR